MFPRPAPTQPTKIPSVIPIAPNITAGEAVDLTKLTAAADAMRTFVETAATTDKEEQKPPPTASAVPGNTPATQMATTARQSYQKTARWMLAALAAVGVLIFGSLPFAAIANVKLTWPAAAWLIGGLLIAVAGIVTAIIAVSLVNEPEDASLGELDSDLKTLQKTDEKGFIWINNKPVIKINKLQTLWNPRLAARVELVKILHGEESSAHLGPNLEESDRPASVTSLIKKLGALESDHARLAPTVAKHTVAVESYEKRTAELTKLLEELRNTKTAQNTELNAASSMYTAAATKLDQERATLTTKQQELAETDNQLKLYHDHRDLVLAESAVMQLRGTFRLARRILAIAAMLTLIGGTTYALSLPGATPKQEPQQTATTPPPKAYTRGLPATVVVHEGTKTATELPKDCLEKPLKAIWPGNNPLPTETGPFTAVVTDPTCPGQLTVPKGEGRITLTS